MNVLRSILLTSIVASPGLAQPSPYRLTRYSEDWSFLKDGSKSHSVFDPIKYIPLGRDDVYLSFGGEARLAYEFFDNNAFGAGPQDGDGFLLQRYLIHADFHATQHFRAFVDIISSLEDGRVGGPRPIDENRLDLNQAFVDLSLPAGDETRFTFRPGRQELLYGSARLITNRAGGPNTKQSFDGFKLISEIGDWQLDTFWVRPVETDPGEWNDSAIESQSLWAAYATGKVPGMPGSVDVYYIGFHNLNATYAQGSGDETRHTIGTRLFGRQSGFDWNYEAMYQFGEFDDGRINAWSVGTDTGYTLENVAFTPRLGLKANVISGDTDPNDNRLGSFNALFPRGGYFGEIAVLGPRNLINLHPSIDLKLRRDLTLAFDTVFFWRYSEDDGLYNTGGVLTRPPGGSEARYIGAQPSVILSYRPTAQLTFAATYTIFFPGEFIEETGPSETIHYFRLEAQLRF